MTDLKYGGLFWSVDWLGRTHEPHKQVYAQAFGIYGMSEYYRASGDPQVLEDALTLYGLIEDIAEIPVLAVILMRFQGDWTYWKTSD
jgi:mannobiose 2-epimerase